jgi:hypothetical protein
METQETAPVSIEKLTRIYIKMRDKKAEMTRDVKRLEGDMDKVKSAMLQYMKDEGIETVRTESGLVYRTVRTSYGTDNWEAMYKFILDHQVPHLLSKSIVQSNMKVFLEENPDLIPPGLNANAEYSVTVRGN